MKSIIIHKGYTVRPKKKFVKVNAYNSKSIITRNKIHMKEYNFKFYSDYNKCS